VLGTARDKLMPNALTEQNAYEGVLDAVTRD
jgi:hypothetical protein